MTASISHPPPTHRRVHRCSGPNCPRAVQGLGSFPSANHRRPSPPGAGKGLAVASSPERFGGLTPLWLGVARTPFSPAKAQIPPCFCTVMRGTMFLSARESPSLSPADQKPATESPLKALPSSLRQLQWVCVGTLLRINLHLLSVGIYLGIVLCKNA